jgi:hypothetical protein
MSPLALQALYHALPLPKMAVHSNRRLASMFVRTSGERQAAARGETLEQEVTGLLECCTGTDPESELAAARQRMRDFLHRDWISHGRQDSARGTEWACVEP